MRGAYTLKRLPYLPLAGMLLVVLATSAALWLVRSQAAANERVIRALRAEVAITSVLERARALESAHRGLLIAGNAAFHADIRETTAELWRELGTLRGMTADNPRQQANFARLFPLVRDKIGFANDSARLVLAGRRDEARSLLATGRGRWLMDHIRGRVERMLAEEQRTLGERASEARNIITALGFGLAGAVLLVVLIAGVTVRDARRRSAEIEAARDEARATAAALHEQMEAREAIEAQIRQMHKMESIGQLTGGIAHDFNNMLAIVIGSLDLAQRHFEKPAGDRAKILAAIGNAREGAERAAALTSRLLAFARQQPLAPVPLDANRLVSGMSELLRRTIGEQIAVETVLAGGLWATYADPGQLENAILNLAVNARDAMPDEGGRLTIETANAWLDEEYVRAHSDVTSGQYVLISITDTGCGMTADVLDRVFDPFFTTKEVGKGTGLGLSQVFGFVKQSHGHVALYSEPGRGTTVKLYLPRHHGPGGEARDRGGVHEVLPEGRPEEIILVVEDEQRVRHFSVDALREFGYGVISASSGREALKLLAEHPNIVLLFTDVVMPEMDGRKLADQALALRPDLRILYTTGYTRNAVVHNGTLDPGVAFLAKPFTIAQLARKIREVLDGTGANRPV